MIHVAGAGLAGLTIARALADAGRVVHVYEATSEIGGACREAQPGVPLHGPHTFHTSNPRILDWLKRFAVWQPVTRSARSHDLQTQLPIDRRYLIDFLGLHGFLRLSE